MVSPMGVLSIYLPFCELVKSSVRLSLCVVLLHNDMRRLWFIAVPTARCPSGHVTVPSTLSRVGPPFRFTGICPSLGVRLGSRGEDPGGPTGTRRHYHSRARATVGEGKYGRGEGRNENTLP